MLTLTALLMLSAPLEVIAWREQVDLTVGQTILIEDTGRLKRRPNGVLLARALGVKGRQAVVVPPAVAAGLPIPAGGEGPGWQVNLRYALRGRSPSSTPQDVRFTVEVRDLEGVVARWRIVHRVTVTPPAFTSRAVEEAERTFLAQHGEAQRAYAALPSLHDVLPASGLARPPPRDRVPEAAMPDVLRFLSARLQANSAAFYLRAAADAPDPVVAKTALFALVRMTPEPTRQALEARAIDGLDAAAAIALSRATLDRLAFDEAEGMLRRLRKSGSLVRGELAEVLGLLGTIHALRKKRNIAGAALESALCLEPKLRIGVGRPALEAPLEETRARAPCSGQRLSISSIVARRSESTDGPAFVIETRFGPDPHRIASGGTVELWGYGGAMYFDGRAQTTHDPEGRLTVTLREPDGAVNDIGEILVKVFIKDVSGVVLASRGASEPISLAVGDGPGAGGIPTWLWITAGAAALVGGATAVGVWAASQDRDPVRGIGPIEVRF